jgi:hypothetical protein
MRSIARLTALCLGLAVVPAFAQVLYDNGPINGNVDAWTINFGFIVSDTLTLANDATMAGFAFGARELPGDSITSVEWSVTSAENSGTVYGSGTASGSQITDKFLSNNEFGYDIDLITITGLKVDLNAGTYWLNLQNAQTLEGNIVFWDENSGVGCGGDNGKGGGCPSQASENTVGTIPSESFTINGGAAVSEPNSIMLFGSGVFGLAGVFRRRLWKSN